MDLVNSLNKQKNLEKIKKLLNQTVENGATPEEAATAVALAQKLMFQAGITKSEISLEDTIKIIHDYHSCGTKSVSRYQFELAHMLSKHFACEVLISNKLVFVGESDKVEGLKLIFQFCYNVYQKTSEVYLKQHSGSRSAKLQLRWDYFTGFKRGVDSALSESEKSNALVVYQPKEVKEYISDTFSVNKKTQNHKDIMSFDALFQGMKDGASAIHNKDKQIEND